MASLLRPVRRVRVTQKHLNFRPKVFVIGSTVYTVARVDRVWTRSKLHTVSMSGAVKPESRIAQRVFKVVCEDGSTHILVQDYATNLWHVEEIAASSNPAG